MGFIPSSSYVQSAPHAIQALTLPTSYGILVSSSEPASVLPSGEIFEPVIPDTSTLIAFLFITLLSGLAAVVWQTQVVPVSRTNLALDKKQGQVRDYLDELRGNKSRPLERWIFTDWLQKKKSTGGRLKEPALPVLKDAKWNSGDNPVLVATALISMAVIVSSLLERIFSPNV